MNLLDLGIIGFLFLGAFMGARKGFIRGTVALVGLIGALVLAFLLKDFVSALMYQYLPFFNLFGEVKGIQIFNIIFYEMLAFLIVFMFLLIGYRLLLLISSILETILNMTFLLAIPSKLFGAVIGIIHYLIIIFIGLYIFSLPFFNNEIMRESRLSEPILTQTPILSLWTDDAYQMLNEFIYLKTEYKNEGDVNHFNLEALNVLLKYRIVEVETIDNLVASGKLNIDEIEKILREYR